MSTRMTRTGGDAGPSAEVGSMGPAGNGAAMTLPTETARTALDDLARELRSLAGRVGEFAGGDDDGQAARLRGFGAGLIQDLALLEASLDEAGAGAHGESVEGDEALGDDAAWLLPSLALVRARLTLGERLGGELASLIAGVRGRLDELEWRMDLLGGLRRELPPLIGALEADPRGLLERAGVPAALESDRLPRARADAVPPEVGLAAAVIEACGLQQALDRAAERESSGALAGLGARLVAWLDERLDSVTLSAGAVCPEDGIAVGLPRSSAYAAGQVVETLTPGFAWRGRAVARPVVLISSGRETALGREIRRRVAALTSATREGESELSVAERERELADYQAALDAGDEGRREALGRALGLMQNLAARVAGDGADEDLGALLEGLAAAAASDLGLERLAPIRFLPGDVVPTSELGEGGVVQVRKVYSVEREPGQVVRTLRPGARAGGVVIPAIVELSAGPPAPGIIDEVLDLLPLEDGRAAALRERIERARRQAAGDAGEGLATVLAELSLELCDDTLLDAARLAVRLVIDAPPSVLSGRTGWESLREFLDEQLEILLEDGENGEHAVLRLTRPWFQALAHGDFSGCRLRSLGESLRPLLSLYDEGLAAAARAWLFGELERLDGASVRRGGHGRRLLRSIGRTLSDFAANGETTAAIELAEALAPVGLTIVPRPGDDRVESCPSPLRLFHRFEARWDDQRSRGSLLNGSTVHAVTSARTGGEVRPEQVETGAVTLSLGPEPRTVRLLRTEGFQRTRLGPAGRRLVEELERLDRDRLIGELQGDAGTESRHAAAVATLMTEALQDSGWSRGESERAELAPLFEAIREDFGVEMLPGYVDYRRLSELVATHGQERVAVRVSRGEAGRITVGRVGALHRDELLGSVDMDWIVGPPPSYVDALRRRFPWFAATLAGQPPGLEMPAAVREAILDFISPDGGGEARAMASIARLVRWLGEDHPKDLEAFCDFLRVTDGLELEVFPLPGTCSTRGQLLDRLGDAGAITVKRDPGRPDGEAARVESMGLYRDGKLVHGAPRGVFSLVAWSHECEDFREAAEGFLGAGDLTPELASQIERLMTRMALTPEGRSQVEVEREAFAALLKARRFDPQFPETAEDVSGELMALLTRRLTAEGLLDVERFERFEKFSELERELGTDSIEVETVLTKTGSREIASVRRPLVRLDGRCIQVGTIRRGLGVADESARELDELLLDTVDRLDMWREGRGASVVAKLDESSRRLMARTLERLAGVRKRMHRAAASASGAEVLPPRTAVRDLLRFAIDQLHRLEDAIAIRGDKVDRRVYLEDVFRDLVFRGLGPCLSREFDITIDMSVVVGAETPALTGRFKLESGGPKPKKAHPRIFSVVVPCYSQDGVTIRPATVRTGDY